MLTGPAIPLTLHNTSCGSWSSKPEAMLSSPMPEESSEPSTAAAPWPSAQSPSPGMLSPLLTWGSLCSCSSTLGCLQDPALSREASEGAGEGVLK